MKFSYNVGSVKLRILIIVLAISAAGGLTYFITNIFQINNAKSFGNGFVATIKEQDNTRGYDMIDSSFRESMGAYYGWSLWSSSMEKSKSIIPDTPTSINREGLNFLEPKFVLFYDIGNGLNLRASTEYKNNTWRVTNYAVLGQ